MDNLNNMKKTVQGVRRSNVDTRDNLTKIENDVRNVKNATKNI